MTWQWWIPSKDVVEAWIKINLILVNVFKQLISAKHLRYTYQLTHIHTQSSSSFSPDTHTWIYYHTGRRSDVHKTLNHKTETFNLPDWNETETFHFSKLSKTETRRSTFKTETRRSKKRLETAVSQFKNTNWWSLSVDNLFLVGQIHYSLPDISASLMHCMYAHKT